MTSDNERRALHAPVYLTSRSNSFTRARKLQLRRTSGQLAAGVAQVHLIPIERVRVYVCARVRVGN